MSNWMWARGEARGFLFGPRLGLYVSWAAGREAMSPAVGHVS